MHKLVMCEMYTIQISSNYSLCYMLFVSHTLLSASAVSLREIEGLFAYHHRTTGEHFSKLSHRSRKL